MDDDDAWLAALAGRPADVGDARAIVAAREGRLMRDALLAWKPSIDPVRDGDPEHLAALVARARAEGLFEARTPGAPRPAARPTIADRLGAWWGAPRSPRGAGRWATAFVVVAVIATAYVMRPPGPGPVDDDRVRSAPDAVTLLRASDPAALRGEIVEALAARGVRVSKYARFGRLGIDADLATPLPPEVQAILARYRIPPPADGVLRVEIEAAR